MQVRATSYGWNAFKVFVTTLYAWKFSDSINTYKTFLPFVKEQLSKLILFNVGKCVIHHSQKLQQG